MIEIRDLYKRYSPKKGPVVKALDGVTLTFPDRGMVFILGKSGSGKSTLLNVLGGLDSYDSGEIVIKGKSSKNFTQSDFDSYRNTFLGFIFQEYNILSEFNVGQNIALAMQLQGRVATTEELNRILDQVDLTGYATRKTNELSGGQKQRVAIARALIKDPEIIMADEPTGALDSNTGKQVFETLQKLSREKLVIIVSHDREFAEQYGDRVIELADGRIISDITKTASASTILRGGVQIVDDKVLQIRKGYQLTAQDLTLINNYMARNQSDLVISADDATNAMFRRTAKISADGAREGFASTASVETKTYDASEFKMIKSRLPFRHSFRMGSSSLKLKPVRLVFTILLSLIAFGLFGFADTMAAYDKNRTFTQSMIDSGIKYAVFQKYNYTNVPDLKYEDVTSVRMNEYDLARLNRETGLDVKAVHGFRADYDRMVYDQSKLNANASGNFYDTYRLRTAIAIGDGETLEALDITVKGRLPAHAGEIAIPQYLADLLMMTGVEDDKGESIPNLTEEGLFGIKVYGNIALNVDYTDGVLLEIVGIIDTGYSTQGYEAFLPSSGSNVFADTDYVKSRQMDAYLSYGMHTSTIVHQDLVAVSEAAAKRLPDNGSFSFIEGLQHYSYMRYEDALKTRTIVPFARQDEANALYLNAIDISQAMQCLGYDPFTMMCRKPGYQYLSLQNLFDMHYSYQDLHDQYASDFTPNDEEFRAACIRHYNVSSWSQLSEDDIRSFFRQVLQQYEHPLHAKYDAPYAVYRQQKLTELTLAFRDQLQALDLDVTVNVQDDRSERPIPMKIAGFFSSGMYGSSDYFFVTSQKLIDSVFPPKAGVQGNVMYAIAPLPTDRHALRALVDFNYTILDYEATDVLSHIPTGGGEMTGGKVFELQNTVSVSLSAINDMIEMLSQIFIYIGLGFALFAALMMLNFISMSITQKKREIGILRAVGARSGDVFGIFFTEAILIALINFVLAVVALFVGTHFMNGFLRNDFGLGLTILNIGIRQIGLMFGISILVAFIASFVPVFMIARRKPIDAIANR